MWTHIEEIDIGRSDLYKEIFEFADRSLNVKAAVWSQRGVINSSTPNSQALNRYL